MAYVWYTDGSSINNPHGPGGWCAFLTNEDMPITLQGGSSIASNNQMELKAVIECLRYINTHFTNTFHIIYTDSLYVKNGIYVWIHKWKQNGWKTSIGTDVKNKELWLELDKLKHNVLKNNNLSWEWVKGHSKDVHNDYVDSVAYMNAKRYKNEDNNLLSEDTL
jgi:ribonuclease HI